MDKPGLRPDSNLLVGIDAALVALVSAAICLRAHDLPLMSILVPALIVARMIAVAAVARREQVNISGELLFLLLCTLLGAFNDWNSVHNHRIYDYAVPHYFEFSQIPLWMLLYWGMILRLMARLTRWQALAPPTRPSNWVGFGRLGRESALPKVVLELLIVFTSRQAIYKYYADPLLSWLPFALGLAVLLMLIRPTRHDLKLLGITLIVGPLIEVLYIRVAGLHHYQLGWICGVPLWIVLWWLTAILVFKDLTLRFTPLLQRGDPG
ncbi:MAG: hypothetical protein P9M14_13095 [Candidatus Alcyoniella australis]|nr:hypothetical protein [Candidatus Alcyoniella australis]